MILKCRHIHLVIEVQQPPHPHGAPLPVSLPQIQCCDYMGRKIFNLNNWPIQPRWFDYMEETSWLGRISLHESRYFNAVTFLCNLYNDIYLNTYSVSTSLLCSVGSSSLCYHIIRRRYPDFVSSTLI